MKSISQLVSTFACNGKVEWIGIRPKRRADMKSVTQVEARTEGLSGDHNQSGGKRSVTLIQAEHLTAISAFMDRDLIEPEQLRRNIVVSKINLLGLRNQKFQIGEILLEGSGICAPCSRMEEALGTGGYTAVRGHGGITARILEPGTIRLGDQVVPQPSQI